jgi:hypothetical protein
MAYVDRMTTFEDSEKESEFGYVRKVRTPTLRLLLSLLPVRSRRWFRAISAARELYGLVVESVHSDQAELLPDLLEPRGLGSDLGSVDGYSCGAPARVGRFEAVAWI